MTNDEVRVARFAQVIKDNGLPPIDKPIIDMKYTARGDWWVLTDDGWFWLRGAETRESGMHTSWSTWRKWQKSQLPP